MTSNRTTLNKAVHGLAFKLDMDHATLSDFACVTFEVSSMKDLKVPDLQQLVRRLEKEVANDYAANEQQIKSIYYHAYRELDWDSKSIKGFLKKQTGRWCSVQDLSSVEATKVINGLRVLVATGYGDKN